MRYVVHTAVRSAVAPRFRLHGLRGSPIPRLDSAGSHTAQLYWVTGLVARERGHRARPTAGAFCRHGTPPHMIPGQAGMAPAGPALETDS